MPSVEEDHDHDLSRYTRRCSGHHRRWILWTVNAAIGKVDTRRRGVRKRERSAAPVPRRIGSKLWTGRKLGAERFSLALFRPRHRQHHHHQQHQHQHQHHHHHNHHHHQHRHRHRHRQNQRRKLDRNAGHPIVSASSTDLSFARATPRSTDRRPIPPSVAPSVAPSVHRLSRYRNSNRLYKLRGKTSSPSPSSSSSSLPLSL